MDKAMTTEEIAVMVKDWCLYRRKPGDSVMPDQSQSHREI
jgi:hypothetical protein